jgi:hypothetical protein
MEAIYVGPRLLFANTTAGSSLRCGARRVMQLPETAVGLVPGAVENRNRPEKKGGKA